MTRLLECGCCGQFHPAGPLLPGGSANYMNDCRYDANRFNGAEEYQERTGKPAVEVWLDEQEICSECGAPTDDGEGYDGKCGDCADRAENKKEAR